MEISTYTTTSKESVPRWAADLERLGGGQNAATPLRQGQAKPFPRNWGVPPLSRTRDYVIWPYGYGAGSSTISEWIEENYRKDARLALHQGSISTDTATEVTVTPKSTHMSSGGITGQRRPFPPHWGEPPANQSYDFKTWPAGYGVGSSTVAAWIEENLAKDTASHKGSTTASGTTPPNSSVRMANSASIATPTVTPRTPRRSLASQRSRSEDLGDDPIQAMDGVRSSDGGDGRLASVLCSHTNRKIQQMLLVELEQNLIKRIAYLSACLHYWHAEVMLSGVKSTHEELMQEKSEELARSEHNFQLHISKLEAFHTERWNSAAAKRKESRRRLFELIYAEWEEGDAVGLAHTVFKCWSEAAIESHAVRLHKDRAYVFGCVLSRLASAQQDGLSHFAFYAWHEFYREAIRIHQHQAIVGRMALRWYETAEGQLKGMFMTWKGLARHRRLALETIARGTPKALLSLTLRSWIQCMQATAFRNAKTATLKRAMLRWMEGNAEMMVKTTFNAMAQQAMHGSALRKYKRDFEDYLNGTKADYEAAKSAWLQEKQMRKERAAKSVEMMILQWGRGQSKGLYQSVFKNWRVFAHNAKVQARSKASVHLAVQKALEGPLRGLKHSVFGHWKVEALESRHEQHRADIKDSFDKMLTDERNKYADEMNRYQSMAEQRHMRAKASIEAALAKALFGDAKGAGLEIFHEWAKFTKRAQQMGRMRQAVHSAILSALAGKEKGSMQMCFKNWSASRPRRTPKSVQMVLAKWLRGQDKGLQSAVFEAWNGTCRSRLQRLQANFILLQVMVTKDGRAVVMQSFLAWQAAWQESMHERAHQELLAGVKSRADRSLALYRKQQSEAHFRRDEAALCRTVYWAWHSQARRDRHERDVERVRLEKEKAFLERASLEEQLVLADSQIFNLTESLQRELKSKEDLAAKLQAAYAQMRRNTLAASPGPIQQEMEAALAAVRSEQAAGRLSSPHGGEYAASEVATIARESLMSTASVGSRRQSARLRAPSDQEDECNWDTAVDRMTHGGMEQLEAARSSEPERPPRVPRRIREFS